jgi:drug/metabolite transporter (DMT)-like permease
MSPDHRPAVPLRELALANFGLLLMIFVWGAFFPLVERLLLSWDFFSATVSRQLLGSLILAVAVFAQRGRIPLPQRIPWGRVLLMGAIGVSLGSLMTSLAVKFAGGLSSAIMSATNPVGSALAAAVFYREPLGRGMIFATILSVAGGLITALGSASAGGAHFQGGEIFIVTANLCWTWMSMAAQRWLRGYSQLQITALTVGAGAFWLLLLLPVITLSGMHHLRIDLDPVNIGVLLFAGIFPIAVGNFCWNYGVSRTGIVVASMYNNLLPAAAVVVTVFIGGSFSLAQLGGAGVILVGVLGVQILALRRRS